MKTVVCYICVSGGPLTHDYAARFVGSYLENPPGYEHQTVIVCNGGPLPLETALLFQSIPCQFYPRVNDPGYDVSAYQDVARHFPCDMLVCAGESIYFHKPGWLKRYVDAWNKHGEGMFGTFSSNLVRPHLNTTGFCVAPKFLNGSPKCQSRQDRYSFEHGENSLWRRIHNLGFPVRCVTWDGEWLPQHWRNPRNILWKNDQSGLLMWCSHTDRFFAADPETRKRWQAGADGNGKNNITNWK